MRNLLVPIDPDHAERTRSAVAEAVRIYREDPVEVCLLRVQPRLDGHVALCLDAGQLRQLQQVAGEADLVLARSLLQEAGVPCAATVRVGRSAETIARTARELGCNRIVFGQQAPGFGSRVFGSLAQQVRHLLGGGEFQVLGS